MEDDLLGGTNFVTCINWVKKGLAKKNPIQIQYTKDELKEIFLNTTKQLKEESENNESNDIEMGDESTNNNHNDQDIIDKYGLEDYSDSEEDSNVIGGFGNLVQHASNENDEYLNQNFSDSDSEKEDFNLKDEDNLILIGNVHEDAISLEVHVYNNEDNYVHHDVYLPAYPMCIETISFDAATNQICNYAAIGDMKKNIGIWDIDVVNELEPKFKFVGHNDAVLDLSWNKITQNILASCSVDQTIILWDLNIKKRMHKFNKFSSKIQSIEFHGKEKGKLLTGHSDGKILIIDCDKLSIQNFSLPDVEIEKVIWNPYSDNIFLAATDKGSIHLFDYRVKQEITKIEAHSTSVTDLSFSCSCPNLFLSSSADKTIKIWDLSSNKFNLIEDYKDVGVGKVFCMSENPDLPTIFAVGGDNRHKPLEIIDISKFQSVKSHFNLN